MSEFAFPTTVVHTPRCMRCGKSSAVHVPSDAYRRWVVDREPIQVAMPEMDLDTREMLISGTHPECWDAMFGVGADV